MIVCVSHVEGYISVQGDVRGEIDSENIVDEELSFCFSILCNPLFNENIHVLSFSAIAFREIEIVPRSDIIAEKLDLMTGIGVSNKKLVNTRIPRSHIQGFTVDDFHPVRCCTNFLEIAFDLNVNSVRFGSSHFTRRSKISFWFEYSLKGRVVDELVAACCPT